MKVKDNFYCQNESGDVDFSINVWYGVVKDLELTNLTEKEKIDILFPDKCETQCIDCACIVGSRRLKTKELITR